MTIIKSKYSPSRELRIPSILSKMKKNVCKFVFYCIQENICDSFKEYFHRSKHETFTKNNSNILALALLKLKFRLKSFAVITGRTYNELPLDSRTD